MTHRHILNSLLLIFLISSTLCQIPECIDDPLSVCNTDNIPNTVFLNCKANSLKKSPEKKCQCHSDYYYDKIETKCKRCDISCIHLACKGPLPADCTENNKKYYIFNLFTDPSWEAPTNTVDPEPVNARDQKKKILVNFKMNKACSTTFLKLVLFHAVTETAGYTFEQTYGLDLYPEMRGTYVIDPAESSETTCTYGPNSTMVYGGQQVIRKFIYNSADSITYGYDYIETPNMTYPLPSPYDTPSPSVVFDVLLVLEEAIVLLVGSQNVTDQFFVFDYHIGQTPESVSIDGAPKKFVNVGDNRVLIIYASIKKRTLLEVKKDKTVINTKHIDIPLVTREIDAAYIKDPLFNKDQPLVAIFYDEIFVEIFMLDSSDDSKDFISKIKLSVTDWDSQPSNNVGNVHFVPFSNFVVVSKFGETKIVFKNFIDLGKNDRVLETALPGIFQTFVAKDHKMLTVFDSYHTAILQFALVESECGHDPMIKSCSSFFYNDNIECNQNASWNIVDRKCFCLGGYFLESNTRTCQKCKCMNENQYCQDSPTKCFETPYYDIVLKNQQVVSSQACWSETTEINLLQTFDGKYSSQIKVDLKAKTYNILQSGVILLGLSEARSQLGLSCNPFYKKWKGVGQFPTDISFSLVASNTITKKWSHGQAADTGRLHQTYLGTLGVKFDKIQSLQATKKGTKRFIDPVTGILKQVRNATFAFSVYVASGYILNEQGLKEGRIYRFFGEVYEGPGPDLFPPYKLYQHYVEYNTQNYLVQSIHIHLVDLLYVAVEDSNSSKMMIFPHQFSVNFMIKKVEPISVIETNLEDVEISIHKYYFELADSTSIFYFVLTTKSKKVVIRDYTNEIGRAHV